MRGEIVDVWPPGGTSPVRVDFFGDQIESVHTFDIESLGTISQVHEARLVALGDRTTWPIDQTTSLLTYLPKDTIIWLIEPAEIQEQAKSYFDRLSDARGIYPPNAVLKNVQAYTWAEIHQFGAEDEKTIRLPCKSIQRFDTKAEEAIRELAELTTRAKVVVVCDSKSECTRLSDLLDVKHPGIREKVEMPIGVLTLGFEWNESGEGTEALRHKGTEGYIYGGSKQTNKKPIQTFRDLIAWQKAMALTREIYHHSKMMPPDERFGLTNQMRRAAVSVPSNIAEGYGRQSLADYLKFLRTARGSLAELMTQVELATSMNLLPENPTLASLLSETDRVLQFLIMSHQRKQVEQQAS